MKKENIKELVKTLKKADYKELFAALVLFEKIDFLHDLDDLLDCDVEFLDQVYNKFMESKTIKGLLNEEINNLIDELK